MNQANKSKGKGRGPQPRRVSPQEIIERGIPGFSALKYSCQLNYYEVFPLFTGAGTAGNYVFSTNGCFDPNITSTGHQPMAFDQMMLSFEHYTVVSSKIVLKFRNDSNYVLDVGVSLNAGPTVVTDYTRLVENGLIVRDRVDTSGGGQGMVTLELPCSVAKFGGVPNLLDNPDYKGTIASNPVEQSYYHVSVWNPVDTTVQSVEVDAFITFRVIFTEPRKQSPSLTKAIADVVRNEIKTQHPREVKTTPPDDVTRSVKDTDVTSQCSSCELLNEDGYLSASCAEAATVKGVSVRPVSLRIQDRKFNQ